MFDEDEEEGERFKFDDEDDDAFEAGPPPPTPPLPDYQTADQQGAAETAASEDGSDPDTNRPHLPRNCPAVAPLREFLPPPEEEQIQSGVSDDALDRELPLSPPHGIALYYFIPITVL